MRNKPIPKPSLLFGRCGIYFILAVVLSSPFVLYAAGQALKNRDNQVRQWLPGGLAETRDYDWFLEHFGSEEFVVVSWPGANAKDGRMEALASNLARHMVPVPSEEEAAATEHLEDLERKWFQRVVSAKQAVQQLRGAPFHLSTAQAVERLQGTLLGVDGETIGLLVFVSEEGQADRHAAVETLKQSAESTGLTRDELRLGGPTIDSVALDTESERSRYFLSTVSVLLGLFAAWRCLKKPHLVLIVISTALYCGAMSLAWVHVFGSTMNLVMVTMPTLVYVLAISGAIHLTHYFHREIEKSGAAGAAERALTVAWLPCTLTTITTVVGLGSLALSHVAPVRMFGTYSALGVLTSLPIVLFFLPAALTWWPRRDAATQADRTASNQQAFRGSPSLSSDGHWSERMSNVVERWHWAIAGAGIALILFSLLGLQRLETSVKLINFFSPDSRVLADYGWLEKHLGPLVPVEVVLKFDEEHAGTPLQRVTLVRHIEDRLAAMPHVDGTMSISTFVPPVPEGGGVRQTTQRALLEKRMHENRSQLLATGYLAQDQDHELWRISARVEALNDLDYGLFIEQIRAEVEPLLADARGQGDVESVYTGVVPLVYKAQRVLLNDLLTSFLAAFAIIAVVMLLVLRGIRAGLVSMLPNVFPALVVFGTMGWSNRLCDIGSMMTASVALGIAVDDTIHFLSWFGRGLRSGLSRRDAIAWSYQQCGRAMLQTTMICGVGMLGFAFSEFVPTARFAGLMGTLLVVALIGDLLFLPAVLAGPLGKYFEPGRRRTRRVSWQWLPQMLPKPSRTAS